MDLFYTNWCADKPFNKDRNSKLLGGPWNSLGTIWTQLGTAFHAPKHLNDEIPLFNERIIINTTCDSK